MMVFVWAAMDTISASSAKMLLSPMTRMPLNLFSWTSPEIVFLLWKYKAIVFLCGLVSCLKLLFKDEPTGQEVKQ